MIYYLCVERFAGFTINKTLSSGVLPRDRVAFLSYEQMFHDRQVPAGTYVFTDFDRLTRYELECAAAAWRALRAQPGIGRMLNAPHRVLERVALMNALRRAGVNKFGVWRIGDGVLPERYPVFIRAEDDSTGPETDLIHDENALRRTMAGLLAGGKPLRGRIAVEYCAERGTDGYFRKYGAFKIGGTILPHHVHFSPHWIVKAATARRDAVNDDPDKNRLPSHEREERDYVMENPHQSALEAIFRIAGIDYGRIDYTIVGGRIQVYEINTNPTLPSSGRPGAAPHRQITRERFKTAFLALEPDPLPESRLIPIDLARPQRQDMRPPRTMGLQP